MDISSQFFSDAETYECEIHEPSYLNADCISLAGVFSMLLNLKTKKSPGPDKIPNAFLRRFAEPLAHFLTVIFRTSFLSGVLPNDWLLARVVPVFKKGDHLSLSNYRPISLTCTLCKLLEHIISNMVTDFLDKNNFITEFQHGFRKGYSTVTQLVTTVHEFASTLDKSGQIDAVFIDFSKAFDRVPHGKLLFKLESIGLDSAIVKWIGSYLHGRRQYVEVGSGCSEMLDVTSGVPQGSVLGPLLFLIYVNDIVSVVDPGVNIRLFADDCVLFKDVLCTNDQLALNSSLNSIQDWCYQWKMKLNLEKTVFFRITNKKKYLSFQYKIKDYNVSEVDHYKYLGLTIDRHLGWSKHIDNITSAAFRKLGLIRHKLKNTPPNVKLLAFNTLVRPKLEYGSVVWDPFTKKT